MSYFWYFPAQQNYMVETFLGIMTSSLTEKSTSLYKKDCPAPLKAKAVILILQISSEIVLMKKQLSPLLV